MRKKSLLFLLIMTVLLAICAIVVCAIPELGHTEKAGSNIDRGLILIIISAVEAVGIIAVTVAAAVRFGFSKKR